MLKLHRTSRKRSISTKEFPSPRAKRLRLAFEELGPTFIKAGQMLSTRADVMPADIFHELQKLQDRVPPVPTPLILSSIESELGAPMKSIFSEFEETPIAAASIGQVHRAKLLTGEKVAVKVQRPNIGRIIRDDIDILKTLAGLAERHIPEAELYSPTRLVEEFARLIRLELDYTMEARNLEKFASIFLDDETIHIPQVYWNLTSGRVLTMEFIDGIKVSEIDELKKAGYDVKRIAVKGAEAYLKQIFVHGLFHGDAHPGNIIVLPGEVIGFMDFGIVGRLSHEMANQLNDLLISIAQRNTRRVTSELLKISIVDDTSNLDDLEMDMSELVDRYLGASLNQFQLSELIRELSEISSRHRLRMNRQLTLLGKVLAGIEGVGRQLDPKFEIAPLIEPFAKRLIARKYSPREVFTQASQVARDYADLISALPQDVRAVLNKAKSGKLRIEFKHIGLENIVPELERSTSRLSFAMIIAALVISSAYIMEADIGPKPLFEIPIIGALGYFIAAVSGLWLLVTMVRNKSLR